MTQQTFTQYDFKPFLIDAVRELRFYRADRNSTENFPGREKRCKCNWTIPNRFWENTCIALLPTLNRINPGREEVQLVITAPTRELAQQIYEEIVKLTKFCAEDQMITARCLIGGTDKQRSIEKLKKTTSYCSWNARTY